jgi:hypothetical protein
MLAALDKKRDRRPPTARQFHDLLLEAGMQEDDAILDNKTWTFNTLSEPPPPIDFGPEEGGLAPEDEDDLEADFGPPPDSGARRVQAAPAPPARPPAKPAQKTPPERNSLSFSDPSELEADPFGAPKKTAPAAFKSLRPAAPQNSMRPVPPPPGRGFEAPLPRERAKEFEAPMPAARPNPFEAPGAGARPNPFQPGPAARPGTDAQQPRPMIGAAPKFGSGRPGASRRINFSSELATNSSEDSIGRTIMNWIAVLVAIGVLGFIALKVFDRPDPRKRKREENLAAEGASENAAPADEAVEQASP